MCIIGAAFWEDFMQENLRTNQHQLCIDQLGEILEVRTPSPVKYFRLK